jgi:hypothetical protein
MGINDAAGIGRALRSGDEVEIRGLGSFHPRQKRGRIGRNPKNRSQGRSVYSRIDRSFLKIPAGLLRRPAIDGRAQPRFGR